MTIAKSIICLRALTNRSDTQDAPYIPQHRLSHPKASAFADASTSHPFLKNVPLLFSSTSRWASSFSSRACRRSRLTRCASSSSAMHDFFRSFSWPWERKQKSGDEYGPGGGGGDWLKDDETLLGSTQSEPGIYCRKMPTPDLSLQALCPATFFLERCIHPFPLPTLSGQRPAQLCHLGMEAGDKGKK